MRTWILRTRESFWFLPAVFGVFAVAAALALTALDRVLQSNGGLHLGVVDSISAAGGRSILSIIGTSMLTVAGTSFSITISVLATTSSTYGPRLVRNFLADRSNQVVLAVFTSTFLYALVVLRSVRTAGDAGGGFVPVISIHLAVLLGVADVAVLVFFIHHIADSVQITTLQKRVQSDLLKAIDVVYPPKPRDESGTRPPVRALDGERVLAKNDGYVEYVDLDRLRKLASEHATVIDVIAMPGVHRIAGEPLARLAATGDHDSDSLGRAITAAFSLGPARTPYQDVRFALQQLVEVAIRGLASGTNDPYTAVTALDLAAAGMVPLMGRAEAPGAIHDDDGTVRVLTHWPLIDELVRDIFLGVQTYGLEHPIVVDAALALLARLSGASTTDDHDLAKYRELLEERAR